MQNVFFIRKCISNYDAENKELFEDQKISARYHINSSIVNCQKIEIHTYLEETILHCKMVFLQENVFQITYEVGKKLFSARHQINLL